MSRILGVIFVASLAAGTLPSASAAPRGVGNAGLHPVAHYRHHHRHHHRHRHLPPHR